MYNISSAQWTWVSGNNTANSLGVYGSKGIPSVNSYPGGRFSHSMVFDSTLYCLYVFGGYGSALTTSAGEKEFHVDLPHISM